MKLCRAVPTARLFHVALAAVLVLALSGIPPATADDAACGSANGVPTSTFPTSGLCNPGFAPYVEATSTSYIWTCSGSINRNHTASCSAPRIAAPPSTSGETFKNTIPSGYTFTGTTTGTRSNMTLSVGIKPPSSWPFSTFYAFAAANVPGAGWYCGSGSSWVPLAAGCTPRTVLATSPTVSVLNGLDLSNPAFDHTEIYVGISTTPNLNDVVSGGTYALVSAIPSSGSLDANACLHLDPRGRGLSYRLFKIEDYKYCKCLGGRFVESVISEHYDCYVDYYTDWGCSPLHEGNLDSPPLCGTR